MQFAYQAVSNTVLKTYIDLTILIYLHLFYGKVYLQDILNTMDLLVCKEPDRMPQKYHLSESTIRQGV